jgi:hypothetical protein
MASTFLAPAARAAPATPVTHAARPDASSATGCGPAARVPSGGSPVSRLRAELTGPLALLEVCYGVRPGARLSGPNGLCTFNVLVVDTFGNRYMATSGHCLLPTQSDAVQLFGSNGPFAWAFNAVGDFKVGQFVYAVYNPVRDFALIRLDPGVFASATVCHYGGPTGIDDDTQPNPVPLVHYGAGAITREVAPGRVALGINASDPDNMIALGSGIPGDSGSPVLELLTGRLVGLLSDVGVITLGSAVGNLLIGRIGPQLEEARAALGVPWLTVQTAPGSYNFGL